MTPNKTSGRITTRNASPIRKLSRKTRQKNGMLSRNSSPKRTFLGAAVDLEGAADQADLADGTKENRQRPQDHESQDDERHDPPVLADPLPGLLQT